jgi:hypothetical protein
MDNLKTHINDPTAAVPSIHLINKTTVICGRVTLAEISRVTTFSIMVYSRFTCGYMVMPCFEWSFAALTT